MHADRSELDPLIDRIAVRPFFRPVLRGRILRRQFAPRAPASRCDIPDIKEAEIMPKKAPAGSSNDGIHPADELRPKAKAGGNKSNRSGEAGKSGKSGKGAGSSTGDESGGKAAGGTERVNKGGSGGKGSGDR